jgi:hypothetical protein
MTLGLFFFFFPFCLIHFFSFIFLKKNNLTICYWWSIFLFNLKQKKNVIYLVINNLFLLSQSCAPIMVFFYVLKNNFIQKKFACSILSYKSIKWKIIYGIRNLLNLISCMTCITRLDGRLEFTYFFFIEFFFHKFHYFNIELVGNLAFQFFF